MEISGGISIRSVTLFFFLVFGLYLIAFYGIEYLNHRQGPWEVAFQTNEAGRPSLVVSQPALKIQDVRIEFPDEQTTHTNLQQTVLFERPRKKVPFGKKIYEDLRTLPGVVTFDLFGHEIELLPRVLYVNKREVPWRSNTTIELFQTNKPAQPPKPPKGWEQQ